MFLYLTVAQFLRLKEIPKVVLGHLHCDVADPKGAAASSRHETKKNGEEGTEKGLKPHQYLHVNVHHPAGVSAFIFAECKCKYTNYFFGVVVGVCRHLCT